MENTNKKLNLLVQLIKVNIKAFYLHLIILLVSSILIIIFVATGPKIGQYTTSIVSRILFPIIIVVFYIISGGFLDTSINKKYDFITGILTTIVGIGLWFYTFSISGSTLLEIPSEENSIYWILMNIYQAPFIFTNFLLLLPNIPLLSLLDNFIPTILMGFGLKYKRFRSRKNK